MSVSLENLSFVTLANKHYQIIVNNCTKIELVELSRQTLVFNISRHNCSQFLFLSIFYLFIWYQWKYIQICIDKNFTVQCNNFVFLYSKQSFCKIATLMSWHLDISKVRGGWRRPWLPYQGAWWAVKPRRSHRPA